MGNGLKQAPATAKLARMAQCPVCQQMTLLRADRAVPRFPAHGPRGKKCPGSGQKAA